MCGLLNTTGVKLKAFSERGDRKYLSTPSHLCPQSIGRWPSLGPAQRIPRNAPSRVEYFIKFAWKNVIHRMASSITDFLAHLFHEISAISSECRTRYSTQVGQNARRVHQVVCWTRYGLLWHLRSHFYSFSSLILGGCPKRENSGGFVPARPRAGHPRCKELALKQCDLVNSIIFVDALEFIKRMTVPVNF